MGTIPSRVENHLACKGWLPHWLLEMQRAQMQMVQMEAETERMGVKFVAEGG